MTKDRRGLLESVEILIVGAMSGGGDELETLEVVAERIVDELIKYPDLLTRLATRACNEKLKAAVEANPPTPSGSSVTVTARTPEGEEIGKWVTDEEGRHTPLS